MELSIDKTWEDLIIKELPKGTTFDELLFKPLPELYYQSFASERPTSCGNVRTSPSWLITADLRLVGEDINSLSIKALQNGAESLFLPISENTDFDLAFKGVHLDYIFPIFDLTSCSESKFNDFANYIKSLEQLVSFGLQTPFLLDGSNKKDWKIVTENPSDSIIESMAHACRTYLSGAAKNVIIELPIGKLFYVEIARLRAYRILFANIDAQSEVTKKSNLLCNLKMNESASSDGQILIDQTYKALSAAIGGADYISLQPWNIETENLSRLSQHIQNILKHESHLDHFADAFAGSYFLEDLTNQIVKAVWDKI